MPNPYHDPKTGQFTFKKGGSGGAATLAAGLEHQASRRKKPDPGPGLVYSERYGMKYAPGNEKVVEPARQVPDEAWNELPVVKIPPKVTLAANEETLKTKPIEKVTSGAEPFRPGYITKLWKDDRGTLHVVDGHHRVAMYHALNMEMPARVMTRLEYQKLTRKKKA